MFDHKSDWIRLNLWKSCVRSTMLLPLYLHLIFVGRGSCVRSTMSLSLYFILRGLTEDMKVLCSIHIPLYLCLESARLNIWRSYVRSTLFCIFCIDQRSFVSLLGERLCILVERAAYWIYESRVCDPRSTQLAPHNSTSNHVGGKRQFLFIQIILTFLTHAPLIRSLF